MEAYTRVEGITVMNLSFGLMVKKLVNCEKGGEQESYPG